MDCSSATGRLLVEALVCIRGDKRLYEKFVTFWALLNKTSLNGLSSPMVCTCKTALQCISKQRQFLCWDKEQSNTGW